MMAWIEIMEILIDFAEIVKNFVVSIPLKYYTQWIWIVGSIIAKLYVLHVLEARAARALPSHD